MGEKVEMEEEGIICLYRFDLSSEALMEEEDCVLINSRDTPRVGQSVKLTVNIR